MAQLVTRHRPIRMVHLERVIPPSEIGALIRTATCRNIPRPAKSTTRDRRGFFTTNQYERPCPKAPCISSLVTLSPTHKATLLGSRPLINIVPEKRRGFVFPVAISKSHARSRRQEMKRGGIFTKGLRQPSLNLASIPLTQ